MDQTLLDRRTLNPLHLIRMCANFRGRFTRLQYLIMGVIQTLILIPVRFLFEDAFSGEGGFFLGLFVVILILFVLWIKIAATLRRLNDLEKPGWWLVLGFIPIIMYLFELYLLFTKGNEDNVAQTTDLASIPSEPPSDYGHTPPSPDNKKSQKSTDHTHKQHEPIDPSKESTELLGTNNSSPQDADIRGKLKTLKYLFEDGLIDEDVFRQKRELLLSNYLLEGGKNTRAGFVRTIQNWLETISTPDKGGKTNTIRTLSVLGLVIIVSILVVIFLPSINQAFRVGVPFSLLPPTTTATATSTRIPTITPTPTPTNTPTPSPGDVIFKEGFSNEDTCFQTGPINYGTQGWIENGVFNITAKPSEWIDDTFCLDHRFNDFTYQVDVTVVKAAELFSYGLVFRDGYYFTITEYHNPDQRWWVTGADSQNPGLKYWEPGSCSGDLYYSIYREVGQTLHPLIIDTNNRNEALNTICEPVTGNSQKLSTHTLMVEAKGSRIQLYLDNNRIAQVFDTSYSEGMMGLAIINRSNYESNDNEIEIIFDNVMVIQK